MTIHWWRLRASVACQNTHSSSSSSSGSIRWDTIKCLVDDDDTQWRMIARCKQPLRRVITLLIEVRIRMQCMYGAICGLCVLLSRQCWDITCMLSACVFEGRIIACLRLRLLLRWRHRRSVITMLYSTSLIIIISSSLFYLFVYQYNESMTEYTQLHIMNRTSEVERLQLPLDKFKNTVIGLLQIKCNNSTSSPKFAFPSPS